MSAVEVLTERLPEPESPVGGYLEEDTAGVGRLMEVLESLPESQREAFCMLKLEGLSTAEAARKAEVSVSALKVRAHRAYKQVKKALAAEGE
jgi:RNA polymerase sigma-70 factor (ECF subfamily)